MLEDALWELAAASAKTFGFTFDPACESNVRDFINQGVVTLQAQAVQTGTTPPRIADISIQKAQENLILFISGMVYEALRQGETTILHEWSFFNVKFSICPMWPFCS